MNFKIYWDYFKYILEHKKNVFKISWKRKNYLYAITHDLSKFHPKEFFPYADWFYGPFGKKLEKEYDEEAITNGHSCLNKSYLECKNKFDKAWEHHYKNNPHHWEYWVDEDGNPKRIPFKYLNQMIDDWQAMGLKFCDTAQSYYLNHYREFNLEYETRLWLETYLDLNESIYCNYGHTLEEFTKIYDEETYNKCEGDYIKEKYGIDSYNLLKERKEVS